MDSLGPSGNDSDATIAAADSEATPRRTATPLARGESVGRYVVLDRIGQGGMGIVYAAYDPELDRRVAVKLLAHGPEGNTEGSADRARLVREAQAMAKLAHAHVVAVHDAGTHDGSVFIAMEFVEGGTLGARLAEHPPWPSLLPLLLQAGSGLAAAHAAGLVHRDFKPDNVLLTRDGIAKVSDFGLARAVASFETVSDDPSLRRENNPLSHEITRVGALVGTPAYMAPEQHLHAATDARSDQFSFCVALYEALYGERPFRGHTMSELVYAVTMGNVADAPAGATVPARLRKVVLRGLAVDPDARWPNMEDLLAALQAEPTRRRARMLVLGGLGLALLGGAGGLAALDRRERERCRSEGAAVHASWSDETRERVAATMRSTNMPYVETSIERVEAILDPWVNRWASATEAACLAAARDPEDELPPLRQTCLAERLVHLDVTLELLTDTEEPITSAAVQTVAGLPRLDPCDDSAWLRRRASVMTAAAANADTSLEVTRLIALTRARRPERARAAAQELLVKTRDDPFLQAEVVRAIGQLEEIDVDPTAAVKHLEEAYFLAGKHQNDRTAALAAIDLTMLVGVRIGDLEKGRSWAAHATMMVERDPDPELRNELLYVVGALEATAENYDAAIAAFLEQAAIATETFGPDHPETGYAHIALGNAYSAAGRFDESRTEYELARGVWDRTLGPEHPATVTVVFNLGNLAIHDGRLEDALRLHREALESRERIRRPGHIELAESYSAIGGLLALAGDHEGALAEHRRALAIHQTHYGADMPRTWVETDNVVLDLLVLGRVSEAEPLVAARCEAAERKRDADPDAWIRCLAGKGELLLATDRPEEATKVLEDSVTAAERLYGATHYNTRTRRQTWARALLRARAASRARVQLERVVAGWDEAGQDRHPELREALAMLGQACRATGDTVTAVHSFERALALAQAHGAAAEEIARRTAELADARR